MTKQVEVYNGFDIRFDEKQEVWYTNVGEDDKKNAYDSDDTRVEDASLKKLKEKLDLIKRKKFTRRKVWVHAQRYRRGGGDDEKYESQFVEAMMTSVSPNGTVWTVNKGEKHADKHRIHSWDNGTLSIFEDTPENRALMAEIDAAGEAEWKAEVTQKKLNEKLKGISGKKLYKDVYGKDINL